MIQVIACSFLYAIATRPANAVGNSTVIELDVGGMYFPTTLDTLLSVEDTVFKNRFSGDYAAEPMLRGRYFIDRDGKHFGFILNYLRSPGLPNSVKDMTVLQELRTEADYYGITSFVHLIDEQMQRLRGCEQQKEHDLRKNAQKKERAENQTAEHLSEMSRQLQLIAKRLASAKFEHGVGDILYSGVHMLQTGDYKPPQKA